jgi:hypothetical protein
MLYAVACVVVPAIWGLIAVALFSLWERRRR